MKKLIFILCLLSTPVMATDIMNCKKKEIILKYEGGIFSYKNHLDVCENDKIICYVYDGFRQYGISCFKK